MAARSNSPPSSGRQASQRSTPVRLDRAGARVLVVDDNASARDIFVGMLEAFDFEVTAVDSGAEALAELNKAHAAGQPYSLVLMDWQMPGMDGVEAIRQVRASAHLAHVPAFIMVTGYSREELLQRAGDLALKGLLIKPISPSTLFDAIVKALGAEAGRGPTQRHSRRHGNAIARRSAGAAGRGQCGQPGAGRRFADGRRREDRCQPERRGSRRSGAARAVRCRSHGLPNARHGRVRSDPPHSRHTASPSCPSSP